jgi:flagellar motor protein MotB
MIIQERRPDNVLRDRWMVSYMDVLTILLVFFVAVAAKSVLLKSAPATRPRTPAPVGLQAIRQKLIDEGITGLDARTDLRMESRGLVITLPQAILFRPGQDQVDPVAFPIITKIAAVLRGIPNKVSVIGHADAAPIHNRRFRNNWELAGARGLQLLNLLATRYEIPEARLSMASYGAVAPRTPNNTAQGRAGNRRVEIVILDDGP